jgi:hypothetical protein
MSHPRKPNESKDPVHRMVIYRPKPGSGAALAAILAQHGAALRKVGLITDAPVRVYRATDIRNPNDEPFFVEQFEWRDGAASDIAHQTPEVMAVWETMGPHLADMSLITLDTIG